ncbi:MAG: DUF5680 domain-containing protein [bacterium]|nr:DUF5680 domain-containing protein [bacterium]
MNIISIEEDVKNKIIDLITSGSGNRLISFKPERDLRGADLIVKKRGGYEKNEASFKINSYIGPVENNNLIKDVLQNDFKPDKGFYLIFDYFNEVKREINDYIWVIPSLEFRDIAEQFIVNGKNVLRFESSLDIENKNRYSKFLVNKKELGKLLIKLFKFGGELDFKDIDLEEKLINLERLKEFIIEARKDSLFGGSIPADNPRLIGSSQIEFQKGDFFYQNIFFKRQKGIIGQEIVYQNNRPAWGMNYFGSFIQKEVFDFLETSLLKLLKDCRFGQACELERKEFKYKDEGEGKLEKFFGKEQIFLKGKTIYELNYRGGLI